MMAGWLVLYLLCFALLCSCWLLCGRGTVSADASASASASACRLIACLLACLSLAYAHPSLVGL